MSDMLKVDVTRQPDIRFQDGALPHAAGVKSYQIMRANRAHPELSDGYGWTYNHAAMLCVYHGRFYAEYLSNPVSEHETPGHTLMCSSADGINWSFPQVAFPVIEVPLKYYRGPRSDNMPETIRTVPHQRMGFYRASNDAMLMLAYYGIVHDRKKSAPCDGWGVGRAVRRIMPDGTLGEIYFFIYNEVGGYTAENTRNFPSYLESGDPELIAACRELLDDRPVLNQMYEEHKHDSSMFPVKLGEASCFYTVKGDDMVTVFKKGLSMKSTDGGKTWGEIVRNPSLRTATGKVWGQRTSDGRYALLYNPTTDGQHRWPIACVTGDDGYSFSDMVTVTGFMSPQRYGGLDKNLGPQYLRGVCERNPQHPDGKIHLIYSNNKEDIWISHIPVPTGVSREKAINETGFTNAEAWNFYSPAWAPVRCEGGAIVLSDRDPYDRAVAERCFAATEKGSIGIEITPLAVSEKGEVVISLMDETGCAAAELIITADGALKVRSGGRAEKWKDAPLGEKLIIGLRFDCSRSSFTLSLGGSESAFAFSSASERVCMLSVATKALSRIPYCDIYSNGKYGTKDQQLPGAGEYISETRAAISAFSFESED